MELDLGPEVAAGLSGMTTRTEIPAPGGPPDSRAAHRRALRELVTPQRLREFFAPQSIAMVGASDNSGWARYIVTGADLMGFTGPLIPVHPRAATAFGRPVVPSLRELAGPVDMAFILAPIQAVESVLDELAAAGIRNGVVLAAGYREVGDEGRALEDVMVARALQHGIVLLRRRPAAVPAGACGRTSPAWRAPRLAAPSPGRAGVR
jgi:acetate---CoA ligase (ADP-forming)